jgi:hypothetical protein
LIFVGELAHFARVGQPRLDSPSGLFLFDDIEEIIGFVK